MPYARPLRVLALAAAAACTAPPDAASALDSASVPVSAAHLDFGGFAPRNVVVVNIDTLRADALWRWGSPHATLPRLAARPGWVSVERAVSASSWTAPATTSELTALDLPAHGVRYMDNEDFAANLPLTAPTVAEHFAAQGYATGLFTGNGLLVGRPYLLDRGFGAARVDETEPGDATAVVADAIAWLDTVPAGQPFLLFLQPVDPHGPYRPDLGDLGTWSDPAALPFDITADAETQDDAIDAAMAAATTDAARTAVLAQVRDVYDEQLLSLDRAVDGLITALAAAGHGDDTLVVLAADHGESLYEGDPIALGHGESLRDEQIHVPMMFWGPGLRDAHVPCVASGMDLFPTVLDALGLPAMPGVAGQSLLAACRDHAFSGVYESTAGVERLTFLGVESRDAQVVYDCAAGATQAFDLSTDPRATASLPVGVVPGGPTLQAALDTYQQSVQAALPGLACARGQ